METAGLEEVDTYVLFYQNTIVQYITNRGGRVAARRAGNMEMLGAWGFILGGHEGSRAGGGKKYLFQSVNMKKCGCCKVRKLKEIKGSDKIVNLNISAKFDSLKKTKTTSSESKEKLERSVKGLVTALAFKTKVRSPKFKRQGMPSEMSVRRTFQRL